MVNPATNLQETQQTDELLRDTKWQNLDWGETIEQIMTGFFKQIRGAGVGREREEPIHIVKIFVYIYICMYFFSPRLLDIHPKIF